jgi:hypothetical protein
LGNAKLAEAPSETLNAQDVCQLSRARAASAMPSGDIP